MAIASLIIALLAVACAALPPLFFLGVPLGLLALALGAASLPGHVRRRRFAWAGIALGAAGLVAGLTAYHHLRRLEERVATAPDRLDPRLAKGFEQTFRTMLAATNDAAVSH